MRIIAKVIESMLSKDATQQWTGQTSAVASSSHWGWDGASSSHWGWDGISSGHWGWDG